MEPAARRSPGLNRLGQFAHPTHDVSELAATAAAAAAAWSWAAAASEGGAQRERDCQAPAGWGLIHCDSSYSQSAGCRTLFFCCRASAARRLASTHCGRRLCETLRQHHSSPSPSDFCCRCSPQQAGVLLHARCQPNQSSGEFFYSPTRFLPKFTSRAEAAVLQATPLSPAPPPTRPPNSSCHHGRRRGEKGRQPALTPLD